jgi:vacuolar-type H+-ATPase subunit H
VAPALALRVTWKEPMAVTHAVTAAGQADDELATLVKLRAHEEELNRRLEEARRAAEARRFGAREAAAHLDAQAEADCREELARLRQERVRQLETVLAAVRDETTQHLAGLARRAAANRGRALARLLAAVTGSGTP